MKISRIKAIVIGIPFCMVALTGCGNSSNTATPIVLTTDSVSLNEGDTELVYALTEDAGKVEWTSSDENVASVEDGEILGKQAGTSIITATFGKDTAQCKVVVAGDENEGTYLKAKSNGYYLEKGNKKGIETKFVLCKTDKDGNVTEETATDLKYEMYNKQIASVDENGVIKPLSVGPTSMTVTSGEISCSVDVVVSTKLISTPKDWLEVVSSTDNLDGYYYVTKNLDFSGVSYSGISTGKAIEADKCFRGTIDGGNHTISNIKAANIFGSLLDAKIKNISFNNVTLSGSGIAANISGNGISFENMFIGLNYQGSGKTILADTVDGCGSIEKCLVTVENGGNSLKLAGSISDDFTAANMAVVNGSGLSGKYPKGINVFENKMDAIWKINQSKMFGSDWDYNIGNLPVMMSK